jgi:PKD repeat protein
MTTAFTNAATGAATYDWNFGDGTAHAISTDPSHTYATSGSYTVCLTATSANSCTDSVCKNVVIADPTGIKTNEGGRLSISPNPSQGLFNINFGEAVEGSVSIKVYSILGQEVRNFESRRASASTFVLDLTASDKGVYFIQITSAKGVQTTRVSITR